MEDKNNNSEENEEKTENKEEKTGIKEEKTNVKDIEENKNIKDNKKKDNDNDLINKKNSENSNDKKKFLQKKREEKLKENKEKEELKNIIINFLGDSLTEGLKFQKKERFTKYINLWLGITVNNYGYRGTRIARQEGDMKDFNYRYKELDEKACLNFIFGGTNDYRSGNAELGDINSDSVYTFYGAVKNLIKELLVKFSKDKICFILPTPMFEEEKIYTHGPLSKYREIIKEVCSINGIDYLDLCSDFPVPTSSEKSDFYRDGIHPSKKGHKIIASRIIKYLKEKGIISKLPDLENLVK